MKERKKGKILNVASVAAYIPGPNMAVYYATKAYVLNFTLALNIELKKYNISVSALCPGPTDTNFITACESKNPEDFNKMRMKVDKVAKIAYKKMMKKKAIINTGFVAKMVPFLLRFTSRKFLAKRTMKANGK